MKIKNVVIDALVMSLLSIGFICSTLLAYYLWGETPKHWDAVFGICGIVYIITFVLFLIFVSIEPLNVCKVMVKGK
jgi:hypothetical protein